MKASLRRPGERIGVSGAGRAEGHQPDLAPEAQRQPARPHSERRAQPCLGRTVRRLHQREEVDSGKLAYMVDPARRRLRVPEQVQLLSWDDNKEGIYAGPLPGLFYAEAASARRRTAGAWIDIEHQKLEHDDRSQVGRARSGVADRRRSQRWSTAWRGALQPFLLRCACRA